MINQLSIVIPALNEELYLPKLLDSIVLQKFAGELEIIVVDGESKDKTIRVAEKFKDKLDLKIFTTHRGQAHQRNFGARKARYDHILFIDADMRIPDGMLNRYFKNLDPKKRVVGRVFIWPSKSTIAEYAFFIPAYIFLHLHSFIMPTTSGGFLLTTKDNFEKIGGFFEGGALGDDVDFGKRSVADGATLYTSYRCYALHSSRRAQKMGMMRMIATYLQSYWYYRKKGRVIPPNTFYYPYGEYEGYY